MDSSLTESSGFILKRRYWLLGSGWVGVLIFSVNGWAWLDALLSLRLYFFFVPYGKTTFAITPVYLAYLILVASIMIGPSVMGVLLTFRLLPTLKRSLLMVFGTGTILTVVSLLNTQPGVSYGLSGTLYQSGLPIRWLELPFGNLVVPAGWYPTPFFVLDFVFWSGMTLGVILVAKRLFRRDVED